jgi:hypothetical protein
MKIKKIAVTYGELRSQGFPNFSNKRYELTLEAILIPGEIPRAIKDKLTDIAKREVRIFFGDAINHDQLDLPF